MNTIYLMVNGLPGNVATTIATQVLADERFELVPYSLTGPEITATEFNLESRSLRLLSPANRMAAMAEIKDRYPGLITIDFTHPSAVNDNCQFYCAQHLPFVMGTTGGDRSALIQTVEKSTICAVIAPNMAKQIVGFQAMLEYAGRTFPDMFAGYRLTIKESHQAGKADTSGTAKAMVKYFNDLGVDFDEAEIIKERDPEVQKKQWGVPEAHLSGHGWHTYTLISPDNSTKFEFTHNINGRDIYAQGTFDAAVFLARRIQENRQGVVFSMIDVLQGRPEGQS